MKATLKGKIVAIDRNLSKDDGRNDVTVVLQVDGRFDKNAAGYSGYTGDELRIDDTVVRLSVRPRVADRIVFGAHITIEVEIADREASS